MRSMTDEGYGEAITWLPTLPDLLNRQLGRSANKFVWQAQDFETFGLQELIAPLITRLVVHGAVAFDDEPAFEAHEIRDIGAYGDLPPKFRAEAAVAQRRPKELFGL